VNLRALKKRLASLRTPVQMPFFQYWDSPNVPEDVRVLIDGFARANPSLAHRLYDRKSGREFIRKHFGHRELAAFDACAVSAMQADYLRLCLIYADGGLYLDADIAPVEPLDTLVASAPFGLLSRRGLLVNNATIFFRNPRDLFLGACLTVVTDNILNRRFDDIIAVSGPGPISAIACIIEPRMLRVAERLIERGKSPFGPYWPELLDVAKHLVPLTSELVAAWSRITIIGFEDAERWCRYDTNLDYKKGGHWTQHRGSIYLENGA